MVFCGTFTHGAEYKVEDNKLVIVKEGKRQKFLDSVDQITFSGKYAISIDQDVLYVTERAVFKLEKEGMVLIEIAPGVDLQKDILDQMGFQPIISPNLKTMRPGIFQEHWNELKAIINGSDFENLPN